MSDKPQQAVILIPSLEPDERLPVYVRSLKERGFAHVLIVDDGSSQQYQGIFNDIAQMDGCTVLHHDVNHGKGVALKTGYAWIEKNLPDCTGVITADADGQHTVEDCWRLAEALCAGKRALYLGSRDFNQDDVPPKSRFGNKTTSAVFKLFYGTYLPDTQTGLRAFRREDLGFMQQVEGERFEYEMNVLIACAMQKLEMIPITIKTVYENENSGTHFHPIRDSYRIYKVILGNFFKFMGASILCFVADNLAAWLLTDVAKLLNITAGNITARVFSGILNYLLNRKFVFEDKGSTRRSLLRYIILWICILALSTLGIQGLCGLFHNEGLRWLFKLVCDTVLYFLSYRVQRNWVFAKEKA